MRKYLKALKHDGIFGFLEVYTHYINEKWEDNEIRTRTNDELDPGILFAAERLIDGTVILLDVYQVEGSKTWRGDVSHILLHYLPELNCKNFKVQHYCTKDILLETNQKMDGIIFHSLTDKIFKYKPFLFFKAKENLHNMTIETNYFLWPLNILSQRKSIFYESKRKENCLMRT